MEKPTVSLAAPVRESQIELLRLISQFFIVLSHLLLFTSTDERLFSWLWPLLHIGVPIFVMISGYFMIKASVKGFIKLILMIFVLQVPLQIANLVIGGGNYEVKELLNVFFFVSRSPLWFLHTYIYLYLLSPMINKYIEELSTKKLLFFLVILFVISDYMGILRGDFTLIAGKNIISFMMFYVAGYTIRRVSDDLKKHIKTLLCILVLYNIIIMCLCASIHGHQQLESALFEIVYQYNSPGNLFNAIMVFALVNSIKFHSRIVNVAAKASLSIFILHASYIVLHRTIIPFNKEVLSYFVDNNIAFFFFEIAFSLVIVAICVCIHWLMNPVWSQINKMSYNIDMYISKKNRF